MASQLAWRQKAQGRSVQFARHMKFVGALELGDRLAGAGSNDAIGFQGAVAVSGQGFLSCGGDEVLGINCARADRTGCGNVVAGVLPQVCRFQVSY